MPTNPDLKLPDGASERAAEAHAIIVGVLQRFGATYTGGCRAFYLPDVWRARGEKYGVTSELVVVYDGGDLGPFFRLGGKIAEDRLYQAMSDALAGGGFYSEAVTGWHAAIYSRSIERPEVVGEKSAKALADILLALRDDQADHGARILNDLAPRLAEAVVAESSARRRLGRYTLDGEAIPDMDAFLRANAGLSSEEVVAICLMGVGEEASIGGGAAPLFTVKRVA